MKKFKIYKIVILIIIFAAILLFLADYYYYIALDDKIKKNKSLYDYIVKYQDKTETEINNKYIYDKNTNRFYRPIENSNSKLKPVVIFGFSSVYGLNLDKNETISHNLANLTHRPIYNRTKPEASLNHMYYQLSNNDFYKIVPKPEYILYFYVSKQYVLMNNKLDFCQHDVYYTLKKDSLAKNNKISILKKSYLIAQLNIAKFKKSGIKHFLNDKNNKLFEKILLESKNKQKKHWKNDTKFIVIICSKPCDSENKIFSKLNKNGFKIIELYKYIDIENKKYKDGSRPNAKYWQDAAKIIVKELKL